MEMTKLQQKLADLQKQLEKLKAFEEVITQRRIDADMGDDYRENEPAKLVMERHDVWHSQMTALLHEITVIKTKISELNFGKKVKVLPKDRNEFFDKPKDHLLSLRNKLKNKKSAYISTKKYDAVLVHEEKGLTKAIQLYKDKATSKIILIGKWHDTWKIKQTAVENGISDEDIFTIENGVDAFLQKKNWTRTIGV